MTTAGKAFLAAAAAALLMAGAGAGFSTAGSAGDAAVSKKKPAKFNPKKFKGTWKGTWKNLTFGTSGKASITLKVRGRKKPVMSGTFRLGGSAFGCDSAPPRPVRMKKGSGKNRWNARGFKAAWNNGQGPVRINYSHRTSRLSGSGFSPCSKEITYSFTGTLTSRSATASVSIFLNGEKFAKSRLSMKR